ncbi:PucR family transcriptional regulator [Streptomyces yaizuensis]|uniref:PucR family transcriptional regulator n=1 Tax=Streptomyces yaizuensis TaxID=2989713 RepID=A0ABQ5NT84_9ACTN|nr:PucR family transcriptional regulator ligand-binding domain-containing protein [Streptomyces sp. YSPA8]GLF93588.1 PucR family transcriptional regulator [Streptomyces sp. YSPA8]
MPETTAPPPTPAVPLAALLAQEELGLRQIAGPATVPATATATATEETGTVVHWVHTSEMADPYPYLLGGELLLSAGVLLKDPDTYVARIVAAGAAALGFGVTPVYDTVPPGLVEACDQYGLPLLEVPPQTTFTAVARAVWRLMAEARHRELRRVSRAQQGLATAAARPDPVPAVLGQLAARLDGYAALLTADGGVAAAAGRAPSPQVRQALERLARVVRGPAHGDAAAAGTGAGTGAPAGGPGAPSTASDTAAGSRLAAYAIDNGSGTGSGTGGGSGLVLALATPAREPGDHTVAGVAVVLLSLLTAQHRGRDSAARGSALVRLLLGADPAETAAALGGESWTVVRARGGGRTPFAASALGASLGSALVDPVDERTVRILIPSAAPPAPRPGWVLGVSDPVAPSELAAADAQAARALRRALSTGVDLVRHRGSALGSLLTPQEAAAHARLRLAPLAGSPALVETLRAWLAAHGGWDRTAGALGVHRNTVRQRIARCAALLGEDLDDPDVRMELWFALRSR